MSAIGHAVGDWNSGKKVYPNPEFVNFGRGFGNQNQPATILPFYTNRLNMRTAYNTLGINWNDYRKRGAIVDKYIKQGVSLVQINDFWEKYRLRGRNAENLQEFDQFIQQQRLLQEAQIKKEEELLTLLEEEEKKKEISDLNLFPYDEGKTPTPQPEPPSSSSVDNTKSNTNYLLYGGIGLAVLIGGFIIFKRK